MQSTIPSTLVFVFFFSLLSLQNLNAQRSCGAMGHLHHLQQQDPHLQAKMQQIEEHTQNFISNHTGNRSVKTIPVVVHVVHNTAEQNISDAQILSQIDVLNEDFRRTNADADDTWAQAADSQIEFCLASIDPDGNPTSGITRTSTNSTSFNSSSNDIKYTATGGVDAWPASDYLNIWVCNLSDGILGYAQFPGGPAATDGIVCRYTAFGRVGTLHPTYNLGRTTTHEVGHWLNLRHIWGDGPCGIDDYCTDTPESDAPNFGCALGHSSCGSVDMVQNYMDYSDDACMNVFTNDQATRMHATLSPGGFRESLLYSPACGVAPTCDDGVQNGNETGVDCGGDCAPCVTCNDGVQNGNETGVDCGGDCAPCVTCNDGVQNGNETGVDCGGDCVPCVTCNDGVQNGNETGVDCGGDCTPCQTDVCGTPTGLFVQIKRGGQHAELHWVGVGAAVDYTVQIRKVGDVDWEEMTTANNHLLATGLTRKAEYEWQVRANCTNGSSDWASHTFVARKGGNFRQGELADIMLYPNPAVDFIKVEISDIRSGLGLQLHEQLPEGESLDVSIIDIRGTTLREYQMDSASSLNLDVSQLGSGVYFLQVRHPNGKSQTERFVVGRE